MLLVTSSHDYFQNLVYSHWLGCIFFSLLFSVAGRSLSILLEACCFCLFLVLQVVFVLMSHGFSFINSSVSHSLCSWGAYFKCLKVLVREWRKMDCWTSTVNLSWMLFMWKIGPISPRNFWRLFHIPLLQAS